MANDQLPGDPNSVVSLSIAIQRRIEGDLQTSPGCTGPASGGTQGAVDEQPVVGTQGNSPAVGSDPGRASAGNIQHGLGTGRLQTSARPNDHIGIRRRRGGLFSVDFAANDDAAALAHLTVDTAERIDRRSHAPRHVQHRMVTDPDRTSVGGRIRLLLRALNIDRTELLLTNVEDAAPSVEFTVNGELPGTAQVDALAGIDADARALADGQNTVQRVDLIDLAAARLQ
ncbi:hypothetical protein D3C71_1232540 [compost metagenome]